MKKFKRSALRHENAKQNADSLKPKSEKRT